MEVKKEAKPAAAEDDDDDEDLSDLEPDKPEGAEAATADGLKEAATDGMSAKMAEELKT